jgi:hypothetical protein
VTISKWDYENGRDVRLFTGADFDCVSNNGTKANPCLCADILGDWREEVVWRRSDNTALEIFTTPIATSTRYYTLMHDPQYREAIAWQNVGYNQPPHPGFFLGAADASGAPSVAPTPNLYYAGSGTSGLPPNTYQAELASFGGGTVAETTNPGYDVSGYVIFPTSGGFDQFSNVDGGGGAGGAGVKTLNIRYANGGSSPRTGLLIVNGVSQPITFPTTGSFTSWEVLSVNVPLAAGATNTIRFESSGSDLANIDEISVDLGPETGSISGRVFHDTNDDGAFASEPTLAGITVYLDTNNNGTLDAGEISTTSDGTGNYSFASLPNGTFAVREVVPANYFASNSVARTIAGGAAVTGANLGNELIVYSGTAGGDTYTLQKNGGGQYVISVAGGATYILSPAAPSLTFNLAGGTDALTIDATGGTPIPFGGVSFDGGSGAADTLIIKGAAAAADTAVFNVSAVTFNGGALNETNLESVQFDGNGGWDNVTINGGPIVTFPDAQQLNSLALNGVTLAALAAGGAANMITRSLSIAPTARLDLADNDLAIDYVSSSPLGTWNGSAYTGVTGLIASGYAGSAWTGGGIVTSETLAITPNTLTTLGAAEASQALGIGATETALWNGQTIDGTTVLVKYTYAGDANLDGLLSGDDYFQIDSAFPQGAHGWVNGDFNYDGVVNGDDYFLIDSNFPAQGPPL